MGCILVKGRTYILKEYDEDDEELFDDEVDDTELDYDEETSDEVSEEEFVELDVDDFDYIVEELEKIGDNLDIAYELDNEDFKYSISDNVTVLVRIENGDSIYIETQIERENIDINCTKNTTSLGNLVDELTLSTMLCKEIQQKLL